jgi:hypothetical protein
LIKPLQAFLKLKKPRPNLKTAVVFDQALAQTQWHPYSPWREALKHLLRLFIQHRSELALASDQWGVLPALESLLGLSDPPSQSTIIAFDSFDTAMLRRLDKYTDRSTLNYRDRLQYELVRCRLYAEYLDNSPEHVVLFGPLLNPLFGLCCTGVPPGEQAVAQSCLDNLTQWLSLGIQRWDLPLISSQVLSLPCKHNPQDYRLALLNFIAPDHKATVKNKDQEQPYCHVDPGLFYFALNHLRNINKLLAQFYWPLTGELKKKVAGFIFREILQRSDDTNIEKLWLKLQNSLFDTTQEPFAGVINGKPCETEWLFYTMLITLDHKKEKSQWIKAEHVDVLLRLAQQWLDRSYTSWLAERMIMLILQLCRNQEADVMLRALDSLCDLIVKLGEDLKIEKSFTILLKCLGKRDDKYDPKYSVFYDLCRHYARLNSLIPERVFETSSKSAPTNKSMNLDLFGEG